MRFVVSVVVLPLGVDSADVADCPLCSPLDVRFDQSTTGFESSAELEPKLCAGVRSVSHGATPVPKLLSSFAEPVARLEKEVRVSLLYLEKAIKRRKLTCCVCRQTQVVMK